jgi:glycerol-3-phosphate dehydrogenase (NAD(P)+)
MFNSKNEQKNIQIIGAGSWGTALAIAFASRHNVIIHTRNEKKAQSINFDNISPDFADFSLPQNIIASTKIIHNQDFLVIAIPSLFVAEFVLNNLEAIKSQKNIIIASKGMNHSKPELFSDFFKSVSIEPIFISGANFASEISKSLPTYTNVASENYQKTLEISNELTSKNFVLSPISDYISLQVCGCYKNIIAIYSGYIIAKGLGENFRASICTKAIEELKNICIFLGGGIDAIYSYAGIGDIMLSCFSDKSRNFKLGMNIANSVYTNHNHSIEGVMSVKSLYKLLGNESKKFEILKEVYNIIQNYEQNL